MRKLARAHPEYADLQPWEGVETSDIVYPDEAGVLTTLLREKGYFEDLWAPGMETPKYFIEVKTTTSDCGAAFYMNRSQYALVSHSSPHLNRKQRPSERKEERKNVSLHG